MYWKKVFVTISISTWFILMSLSVYQILQTPKLEKPRLITEQIEHYSPYNHLFFVLILVALFAIIGVGVSSELKLKTKN